MIVDIVSYAVTGAQKIDKQIIDIKEDKTSQ